MSTIYTDNSQSIGNTPLIKLNHVIDGAGRYLSTAPFEGI